MKAKFILVYFILTMTLFQLNNSEIFPFKLYPDPATAGWTPDRNQNAFSITLIEKNSFVVHVNNDT